MTARTVDWWVPRMGQREKDLIGEVIDKGFPNDGEVTLAFEQALAGALGVPYAVAVTSGTAALFLALAACAVGPGDEVIVPDLTFIATANAVRLAGATPVLVDVDPLTFTLDPTRVDAAITPRTRAVVPVHVSGRSAITHELLALARYHGLRIVEDAAEALGSRRGGQALGTFGDAGCFSFTANKTITTGQGGLVVTRDPALHRRLRELKDQGRPERGTGGADVHVSLGYNFKFTNLQAAMGLAQVEELSTRLRHLRRLAGLYRTHLAGVPRVWLPPFRLDDGECPQWIDLWADDRDGLHDTLQLAGIQTRKFWLPLHTQAPYRWDPARFPVSSRVSVGALWLPSSLTLTEEDIVYVCREIADWARRSLRAR